MGFINLSVPYLQGLHRCSLGMDMQFDPILYDGCTNPYWDFNKLIIIDKQKQTYV